MHVDKLPLRHGPATCPARSSVDLLEDPWLNGKRVVGHGSEPWRTESDRRGAERTTGGRRSRLRVVVGSVLFLRLDVFGNCGKCSRVGLSRGSSCGQSAPAALRSPAKAGRSANSGEQYCWELFAGTPAASEWIGEPASVKECLHACLDGNLANHDNTPNFSYLGTLRSWPPFPH